MGDTAANRRHPTSCPVPRLLPTQQGSKGTPVTALRCFMSFSHFLSTKASQRRVARFSLLNFGYSWPCCVAVPDLIVEAALGIHCSFRQDKRTKSYVGKTLLDSAD